MAFKIPKIRLRAADETQAAFRSATRNVTQLNRSTTSMSGAMNKNRRIIQNAGFQISDFAVQVGAGQSAILAMTQQLPQFVQGFGAVGGIAAAGITIFGSLWLAINRSGAAMSSLTPIVGILEDQLGGLMEVMRDFGNTMIGVANVVVNNLDRIIISGLVIAGFFAGKWVGGILIAKAANITFIGSLNLLKATFLRFLPFAALLALGEMVFLFLKLKKGAGSFGEALSLVGAVFVEFGNRASLSMVAVKEAFTLAGQALRVGFITAMNDVMLGYEKFVSKSREVAAKVLKFFNPTKSMAEIMSDFGGSFTTELINIDTNLNQMQLTYEEMIASLTAAKLPLKSLAALRAVLKSVDDQGKRIDVRDWFAGMGGGADGEGGGAGAIENIKSRFMELKDIVESLATSMSKSIGDALTSMVDGTKTTREAFKDMARAIIKQLFDILVVKQIVAGIGQVLGGGIGSGGGLLGGFLGARAHGGPVSAGQSYLVGERGPELFTPSGGGTIARNGSSGGGGMTVNQTVNVNVTTGVQSTVRAEILSLMPQISESAKLAVVEAVQRGGAIAGAF